MADLPTMSVWADDMFDADPIGQAQFQAGLSQCDWSPDDLNGVLYMQSSWIKAISQMLINPVASSDACEVSYAVFETDADGNVCLRTYSSDSSNVGTFGFGAVASHIPEGTSGLVIPAAFPQTTIYTLADLHADDNLAAGTINESQLSNQVIISVEFENLCQRTFSAYIPINPVQTGDVAADYAARTGILQRWRVGGGTWQYARNPSGLIQFAETFNALNSNYAFEVQNQFGAGLVEWQFVWMPSDPATQYVALNANTNITTGTASPRAKVTTVI